MHVYRYAKYIYSRNVCIFKTCKENVVTNNNENKIVTNKKKEKIIATVTYIALVRMHA